MVSEDTAAEMPCSKKLKGSRGKGNCRVVDSEGQGSAKYSRPTLTDFEDEVIIACPIPLASKTEIIDSAKANIIDILHCHELSARHIGDRLLVGNSRGFDHIGRLSQLEYIEKSNQDLRMDIERLKEEVKGQAQELVKKARELSDAHTRIKGLECSVGDFHSTRSRFMSFAKRDKFKSATRQDLQVIAAGNRDVHGGNVIADSRLYTHGHRTDFDVFIFLYGLHPSVSLLLLEYEPTIMLLNRRATYVVSPGHVITKQFNELSSKFLGALETTNYATGYLERGRNTPATKAHWDFLTFLIREGPRF